MNSAWRLPEADLERLVITSLIQRLSDDRQLIGLTQLHTVDAATLEQVFTRVKHLKGMAEIQTPGPFLDLIRTAIKRIDIKPGQMIMTICPASLRAALLDQSRPANATGQTLKAGSCHSQTDPAS